MTGTISYMSTWIQNYFACLPPPPLLVQQYSILSSIMLLVRVHNCRPLAIVSFRYHLHCIQLAASYHSTATCDRNIRIRHGPGKAVFTQMSFCWMFLNPAQIIQAETEAFRYTIFPLMYIVTLAEKLIFFLFNLDKISCCCVGMFEFIYYYYYYIYIYIYVCMYIYLYIKKICNFYV